MSINLEYFGNDRYRLLRLLKELEVEVKGLRYIALSQQEIADKVNFSKLKVNQLMQDLLQEGYLESYKNKQGKYSITEKGYLVLDKMQEK